jgi:hypothetical protein
MHTRTIITQGAELAQSSSLGTSGDGM